ncbi:MAG: GntR family transcriptional regulator [Yoonia sp.]|nr:GntR family transcriptional regulator [Yoonia sp.]MDG1861709.1 GntR family transcriptional regulator [Yoonia sp.]
MKSDLRLSWTEIRDRIQTRILDRIYAPGDKLPKDEDIAAEFGCARSTVQRAMQDLSDIGLVERRRKGGTHVRLDPVTRATVNIAITRREIEDRGSVYGYRLIRREEADAPKEVLDRFGLTGRVKMLHVEALHLSDNRPYILEDRWVSITTAPEILTVDLAQESANEWLVRNKPYSKCDMSFYAVSASDLMARQLDTAQGAALLVIERTTWIGSDPITTVQAVTAPDYKLITKG